MPPKRGPTAALATAAIVALAAGGPTAALAAAPAAKPAARSVQADLDNQIAAVRQELSETYRDIQPKHWGELQTRLGVLLATRGQGLPGQAGIDSTNEGLAALQEALTIFVRENQPDAAAVVRKNIAAVLGSLGARGGGTGSLGGLQIAAASYREALAGYSREKTPADWASVELDLGAILNMIGQQLNGADKAAVLAQSAEANRAALMVYTREAAPAEWASAQNALAVALQGMGEAAETPETKTDLFNQAIAAYGLALSTRSAAAAPADWTNSTYGLAVAEAALADVKRDPKLMRQAIKRLDDLIAGLKGVEAARWDVRAKADRELMKKDLANLLLPQRAPGGEAALRRDIDGLQRHQPIYDEMTPALAGQIRPQIAQLEARVAALGALQSVTFKGVDEDKQDVYEVVFAKGRGLWRITMAPDGKIKNLVLMLDD